MPLQKVAIRPGVNVDFTPTLNEGGWSASNLVRFRDGLAEKLGGWQRLTNTPLTGTVRGVHTWADLTGLPYFIAGSEQRLQIFVNGNIVDITPIRATHNPAVNLSTVINTPTVTVVDASHGATANDWVDFVVTVSVGGLILQGFYKVASVIDGNTYTITAPSNATSTVTNGGAVPLFNTINSSANVSVTLNAHGLSTAGLFNVQISTTVGGITMFGTYSVQSVTSANVFVIAPGPLAGATTSGSENGGNAQYQYLIQSGFVSVTPASGYGVGIYGAGLYGIGSGTTLVAPRIWTLDSFGQNAVGNYNGSTLYQWVPPASTFPGTLISTNPATPVTNAPLFMTASFVSNPQQMVVALGAETAGVQDPNLVRWTDAGNLTVWTATPSNQAGSFRLSTGSRIVGGMVTPNQNLIWTDIDVWSMQYIQPPLIWGFNKIGAECGLVSAHGMGALSQRIFWMEAYNFFSLSPGGIQVLPCPVWDDVFANVNRTQIGKSFCATNADFQEVAWYFPSATGTGEIDSYVKFNVRDNVWDVGQLTRTAWADEGSFGTALGIDGAALIQQHEISPDADGLPMMESIQTGYFDLSDGEMFVFVERIIPDFIFRGGSPQLLVTVYLLEYPNDVNTVGPTVYGPYTITNHTQNIIVRGRARQAALKIQGVGIGTFWRMGAVRHNGQPDGRR